MKHSLMHSTSSVVRLIFVHIVEYYIHHFSTTYTVKIRYFRFFSIRCLDEYGPVHRVKRHKWEEHSVETDAEG